jgi:hypothetical protein
MKAVMYVPTSQNVLHHARVWNVKMTRDQARSFLQCRAAKINKAMREAADDVIREEVEYLGLEWEDKQMV